MEANETLDYFLTRVKLNFCKCEMSRDDYTPEFRIINFVLMLVITPILATFGTVNNAINLCTLRKKNNSRTVRRSATIYLASLAASDLTINFTGMTMFCLDSAKFYSPFLKQNLSPWLICILPVGNTATTCSIYFTIAAAIDCYVAERKGRAFQAWCTCKRARRITAGIVGMSVAYNAFKIPELHAVECWSRTLQLRITEICQTPFAHTFFSQVVHNVYIHSLLMVIAPFCILVVLNHIIIRTIQRRKRFAGVMNLITFGAYVSAAGPTTAVVDQPFNGVYVEQRRRLSKTPTLPRASSSPTLAEQQPASNSLAIAPPNGLARNSVDIGASSLASDDISCIHEELATINATARAYAEDDSSTITLIMVIVLFLLCNVLGLFINIIETFTSHAIPKRILNYIVDISNVLVIVNASANFVIYITFDTTYRDLLKSSFGKVMRKLRRCRRRRRKPKKRNKKIRQAVEIRITTADTFEVNESFAQEDGSGINDSFTEPIYV